MLRTQLRLLRHLPLMGLLLAMGALAASCRESPPVAHFYLVNEPSALDSLRANATHVSLVSPQWLFVVQEGKLAALVDPEVVHWAAERGVPLMPLLLNYDFKPAIAHELLASEAYQEQLIEEVTRVGVEHRFYGIQLDFENVPVEDRDRYVAFVRKLRKALRKRGLKLAVALPAPLAATPLTDARNSANWPQNEQSLAYDYRRLGKEADFVTLMTYDQHTAPDAPGPVAGLPWVEASLRWVLGSVSRKKLYLGLPLYYRQWLGDGVSEGAYGEAMALAARVGASPRLDAEQVEKTFDYEDAGEHGVVWFQDAETLRRRLELVRRYKLQGFSAWRLGHEDPSAWEQDFSGQARSAR